MLERRDTAATALSWMRENYANVRRTVCDTNVRLQRVSAYRHRRLYTSCKVLKKMHEFIARSAYTRRVQAVRPRSARNDSSDGAAEHGAKEDVGVDFLPWEALGRDAASLLMWAVG